MQLNRSYPITIFSFFLFLTITSILSTSAGVLAQTSTGMVIETIDSSGYTYMLIDSGAGKKWVAIPESKVTEGEKVTYKDGMVMKDFSSKTLNRTFDSIIFSPGLAGKTEVQPQNNTTDDSFATAIKTEQSKVTSPTPAMEASGGSLGAITPFQEINVGKSMAANGYTVEEIFAQAKKLNGQKISLHGVVTKVSVNIMGRNWVHLQDGTGNPMQNSHDIVATTSEQPELNSKITIEGILAAEKDFGAGYKYAAIIEQATVTNSHPTRGYKCHGGIYRRTISKHIT